MKPLHYLSLLAISAMTMMASCSQSEGEQPVTNGKSTTVTANLQSFVDETPQSRTQISVDANDQISYRWAVGDVLGIFPDAGTQTAFELSSSSLSADGLSATFDGGAWALKQGHSYYSYFPFSYDCFSPTINKTNIPVSYLGQKQVKFGDTTNAGQYDFNAAGAVTTSTGGLSFDFKRLGALLRIQFSLPATATYKTLTLTASSAVIPVKGKVDLTASTLAYTPTEYASSLQINLNNVSGTVGQTAYVYMMLPPMALKDKGATLTASLAYDSKTTVYNLCTVGTTTTNIPNFTANTRYKREAVYASGDPVGKIDGGEDEQDGHAYVDLGLSVKWATMNVGATEVAGTKKNSHTGQLDCYGEYYAWGETSPKDSYDWSNLKYCTSYDTDNWKFTFSKYVATSSYGTVDNKTILELSDDAARTNWGGTWRMPTTTEQQELLNNCYWEWTSSYNSTGVTGYIIYKVKNASDKGKHPYYDNGYITPTPTASYSLSDNHIFLPAAGYRYDSSLSIAGSGGYYWSSSLNTSLSIYAYYLCFYSGYVDWSNNYRCSGRSVRAVCP